MRPKTKTLTLAVDPNGVCVDQTRGSAGSLSLDGALVGTDPQNPSIYVSDTAQRMSIESAGNLSGITFTITGKGYDANSVWSDSIAEAVTGPNAGISESVNYFTEISDISVSAAVGTNVEIGPVDEAITGIIPVNSYSSAGIGIQSGVTGTVNYDVDYTSSDIFDSTVTPDWTAISGLTAATVASDAVVSGGIRALRVQVNTGADAGEVRAHIVHGDI